MSQADIDEVKFSLAVNNLVENAVKYNKEDGWSGSHWMPTTSSSI